MTKAVIKHQIIEGERWDALAYKYYGDINEMNRLINANPHISFCEALPAGETLLIPIIKLKQSSNNDLPPWMRDETNHE